MCGPWTMVALCAGALNVLLTTALFLSWRTFQNRMITFNAPWARAICVVATEFVSKWINSNVRVNRVRHWCRAIVSSMDLQQIGHHNEHTLHTQLTHRTMSPSTRRGRIQCVIHFRYSIARRDRQSKHNRQIITLKEARVVTRVRHCAKNKARPRNQRTLTTGVTTVYGMGERKVKNKSVNSAPKHQRMVDSSEYRMTASESEVQVIVWQRLHQSSTFYFGQN